MVKIQFEHVQKHQRAIVIDVSFWPAEEFSSDPGSGTCSKASRSSGFHLDPRHYRGYRGVLFHNTITAAHGVEPGSAVLEIADRTRGAVSGQDLASKDARRKEVSGYVWTDNFFQVSG